mmetsp:Transcript_52012/g.161752  ORF Transcript_52012/g.161752 Transcript_52012/m.161752 type:complete len:238 (+) Transcript_52012:122-835(+)
MEELSQRQCPERKYLAGRIQSRHPTIRGILRHCSSRGKTQRRPPQIFMVPEEKPADRTLLEKGRRYWRRTSSWKVRDFISFLHVQGAECSAHVQWLDDRGFRSIRPVHDGPTIRDQEQQDHTRAEVAEHPSCRHAATPSLCHIHHSLRAPGARDCIPPFWRGWLLWNAKTLQSIQPFASRPKQRQRLIRGRAHDGVGASQLDLGLPRKGHSKSLSLCHLLPQQEDRGTTSADVRRTF